MKTAVCLMGLSAGKNDKGDRVQFDSCNSIQKNIIKPYNADVFLHTWNESEEIKAQLLNMYSPKLYKTEPQIVFDTGKNQSIKSRWYSHREVLKLVSKYETENNFEYDYIFITRFDCDYYKNLDFARYNSSKLYVSTWEANNGPMGFLDYWFLSDSKNMKKYGNIYDNLTDEFIISCGTSNHTIAYEMTKKLNIKWEYTELSEDKDFQIRRG
tara:strand:+ start:576 stop:1211 length:636 start_codon:yes stop_codon:yes gene_type:complete